jgi:hypothetical protein
MKIRPVTFIVAVGLSLLAKPLVPTATARAPYNAIMTFQYDLREEKNLRSTCLYCHTEIDGGDLWNPFGTLMKDVFRKEGERKVPETLYETLKRDQDSDKDGYKDVLEVIGKSFPGNAKSKPTQTVEELEALLEARGGIESFKPEFAR